MKRGLKFTVLFVTVLLLSSRQAEADWWDWLEDLSGPGPFHDRFLSSNLALTLKCEDSPVFHLSTKDVKSTTTCVFFDQRFFLKEGNARFDRVVVSITEVGPSIRLHPAIEVGAGVGAIYFSSKGTSQIRLTASFPRLVFNPLLAVPRWQTAQNADLGFFKIYYRDSIIFTPELRFNIKPDTSAKPGTLFSARNERVQSMGFIIDGVALAHLLGRIR